MENLRPHTSHEKPKPPITTEDIETMADETEVLFEQLDQQSDKIKPGYQSARQLQSTLRSGANTIKRIVTGLLATNPELAGYVQTEARNGGNVSDAYAPELVELIKEQLGEDMKPGYQSASQLQSVLSSTHATIKQVVYELLATNPELAEYVQTGARSGVKVADAYAPELVEKIKEQLGEDMKPGYQSINQLKSVLGNSYTTIKQAVTETLATNPEFINYVQIGARGTGGRPSVAYAPELVEKVKETLEARDHEAHQAFRQNAGLTLQFATEVILRLVHNTNLRIEKTVRLADKKGGFRPDLMHDKESISERALISDIKLQTTTESIEEDTKNYTQYIKENYPEGGDLIFLCLNGPEFPSEVSETAENIKIRYYHILDFLERLIDNKRNKFMLHMMTGNESDALSDVPELAPEQIEKIQEIMEQLRVLKDLISNQEYSTKDMTPEEASKKMAKIRAHIRKLARGNVSINDILNTDFKEVMDF